MEAALPLAFSFLISLQYVWLCFEPARFVLKGAALDVAPRFAEVAVTVFMLLGVVGLGVLRDQVTG